MTNREKMKIACALAGISIAEFARNIKPKPVSDVAVHRFLNGNKSANLEDKVDKFIRKTFKKHGLKNGNLEEIAA